MSDQTPDLSTLLAECDKAYQKMTQGPLRRGPYYRHDVHGRSGMVVATTQNHPQGIDNAEGIVTLVNAYPALRDEIRRLHGLVCAARTYIDPDKHPRWEAQAVAESTRCEDVSEALRDEITRLQECERLFTRCNEQRQEFLMRAYAAEDEITRLRSLIARTVVVMDGSWDMLPPHEQDRLAEELRDAALTDAPAPQEKAGTPRSADAL